MTLCVPLLALTMLQGCSKSSETLPGLYAPTIASSALPDLDVRDQQRCYEPGVIIGEQALVELGRTRVALADCRRKHGRVVKAYVTLQNLNAAPTKEATQ